MLQNPCKTLGFKKNMVYKIPPGGEVNHIQPVAYNEIIIDLHVTDLATHLNLFDWLFNHAFQRELYVELRCYT